jgi:hypothetical protein
MHVPRGLGVFDFRRLRDRPKKPARCQPRRFWDCVVIVILCFFSWAAVLCRVFVLQSRCWRNVRCARQQTPKRNLLERQSQPGSAEPLVAFVASWHTLVRRLGETLATRRAGQRTTSVLLACARAQREN